MARTLVAFQYKKETGVFTWLAAAAAAAAVAAAATDVMFADF
jgi:hypothetical protein